MCVSLCDEATLKHWTSLIHTGRQGQFKLQALSTTILSFYKVLQVHLSDTMEGRLLFSQMRDDKKCLHDNRKITQEEFKSIIHFTIKHV